MSGITVSNMTFSNVAGTNEELTEDQLAALQSNLEGYVDEATFNDPDTPLTDDQITEIATKAAEDANDQGVVLYDIAFSMNGQNFKREATEAELQQQNDAIREDLGIIPLPLVIAAKDTEEKELEGFAAQFPKAPSASTPNPTSNEPSTLSKLISSFRNVFNKEPESYTPPTPVQPAEPKSTATPNPVKPTATKPAERPKSALARAAETLGIDPQKLDTMTSKDVNKAFAQKGQEITSIGASGKANALQEAKQARTFLKAHAQLNAMKANVNDAVDQSEKLAATVEAMKPKPEPQGPSMWSRFKSAVSAVVSAVVETVSAAASTLKTALFGKEKPLAIKNEPHNPEQKAEAKQQSSVESEPKKSTQSALEIKAVKEKPALLKSTPDSQPKTKNVNSSVIKPPGGAAASSGVDGSRPALSTKIEPAMDNDDSGPTI